VRILDVNNAQEDKYALRSVKLNQIGTVFIVAKENDITSVTHSFSLKEFANDQGLDQAICC